MMENKYRSFPRRQKYRLVLAVLAFVIAYTVFFALAVVVPTGCSISSPGVGSSAAIATAAAQEESMSKAIQDVAIPEIQYFVERKTIARWAEYWDKPSVVTYVYCVSFGKIMGYYVCSGKPASTQSFLTPETRIVRADLGEFTGDILVEAPDLDGCYGANSPGIRGFTASGIPFEWSGVGATQFIAGAPLPFDVPCLGK